MNTQSVTPSAPTEIGQTWGNGSLSAKLLDDDGPDGRIYRLSHVTGGVPHQRDIVRINSTFVDVWRQGGWRQLLTVDGISDDHTRTLGRAFRVLFPEVVE